MKIYIVIAAVLSLANSSPIRGICASKDPKCWRDDGYGGWVFVDNPKYAGSDQEDECPPDDQYCDLTAKSGTVASYDPRTAELDDSEVSCLLGDNC